MDTGNNISEWNNVTYNISAVTDKVYAQLQFILYKGHKWGDAFCNL